MQIRDLNRLSAPRAMESAPNGFRTQSGLKLLGIVFLVEGTGRGALRHRLTVPSAFADETSPSPPSPDGRAGEAVT